MFDMSLWDWIAAASAICAGCVGAAGIIVLVIYIMFKLIELGLPEGDEINFEFKKRIGKQEDGKRCWKKRE